jgi:putative two-component system response regulator
MTVKASILIVDDEPANRLILEDLLEKHYSVHAIDNGRQTLDYLTTVGQVELILLDVMMPDMDGFEVCRWIKDDPELQDIPVLFLTGLQSEADEERGLALGAVDFIHKPFSPSVVLARVRNHLELSRTQKLLSDRNVTLESLVRERTQALVCEKNKVILSQEATLSALSTLVEIRDNETGNHIRRTQNYVRVLASRLSANPRFTKELSEDVITLLFKSVPLHDVGKVAIPDAILHKPGKLTNEEWIIMKRHTEYGRNALIQAESDSDKAVDFLSYAREIAYGHHEKWDGSGYPQGLSGESIPLSARIMAVADVYDALISKRVYKPAFPHDKAISMIIEGRATHFDPAIIDVLCDVSDEFQAIATSYSDTKNKH